MRVLLLIVFLFSFSYSDWLDTRDNTCVYNFYGDEDGLSWTSRVDDQNYTTTDKIGDKFLPNYKYDGTDCIAQNIKSDIYNNDCNVNRYVFIGVSNVELGLTPCSMIFLVAFMSILSAFIVVVNVFR